jgi:hypothetical protein
VTIGAVGGAVADGEADRHQVPIGLFGEYGFLSPTVMGPQSEDGVRARIAIMAREFGVREFQFYDWFADY